MAKRSEAMSRRDIFWGNKVVKKKGTGVPWRNLPSPISNARDANLSGNGTDMPIIGFEPMTSSLPWKCSTC